jgi:hypothetical protein
MHTAITFSHVPALFDYWYFQSNQISIVLTGFCSFANSACMPLFFLLSGIVGRKSAAVSLGQYFLKRVKKWLVVIIVFWPIIAFLVLSAHKLAFNYHLDYWAILFPNSLPNKPGVVLPFHQFHLWYLVALLLIESSMYLVHKVVGMARCNPMFLGCLILLHASVIYSQNYGYLLTPVFLNCHSIFTILVYLGYYYAGFFIIPENWNQLLNRGSVLRIMIITFLIGYFGAKYLLIQNQFHHYPIVIKSIIVLLDASMPIAVFFIWAVFINVKAPQQLIRILPQLDAIKKYVLNNALWIYLTQIPVVFFILAIGKTIYPIFILEKTGHVNFKIIESLWAFLYWILLSVFSAGVIGLIVYFKNVIKYHFKGWY